jgi:cytochrome c553
MTRDPALLPAAHRILPPLLLACLACHEAPAPEPEAAAAPPVVAAPETVPVATVQQLMDALVIPASATVWDVGREAPADEEAWGSLTNAAVQLAEAGNLLLLGERRRDDEVWLSTAAALREGGARALAAVEARDVDALLDAGNTLIDSCEICHESHLVPPEPAEPTEPPSS